VLPGATYVWTANPPDPTLAPNSANPTVAPTQSTTYTIVATQASCVNSATVFVDVANATLTVSPDATICAGDPITLTANASNGSLIWGPGQQTTPVITVQPDSTTTYNVTLQYGPNCLLSETVTVTVVPAFELAIKVSPSGPYALGTLIELTADVNPLNNIAYTYAWFQNGTTPIGTTRIIEDYQISTTEDSIRFQVEVTSPNGCVKQAVEVLAVQQPIIQVPNAFTPGSGDGNGTFKLIANAEVDIQEFIIYNRWGQKVFNGDNTNDVWDGEVDGSPAPPDVYIYRIVYRTLDGVLKEPKVGEVVLLR
jgi:gliding motility-associated-like protein